MQRNHQVNFWLNREAPSSPSQYLRSSSSILSSFSSLVRFRTIRFFFNRAEHSQVDLNHIIVSVLSLSGFHISRVYPGAIIIPDTSRLIRARCIRVADVGKRYKITKDDIRSRSWLLAYAHDWGEFLPYPPPSRFSFTVIERSQPPPLPVIHAAGCGGLEVRWPPSVLYVASRWRRQENWWIRDGCLIPESAVHSVFNNIDSGWFLFDYSRILIPVLSLWKFSFAIPVGSYDWFLFIIFERVSLL